MEIKPHHKTFQSTFVDKQENKAIIRYGNKQVTVSMKQVKNTLFQAYRNRNKISTVLGTGFPIISLEKVLNHLYGEDMIKGMWSNW